MNVNGLMIKIGIVMRQVVMKRFTLPMAQKSQISNGVLIAGKKSRRKNENNNSNDCTSVSPGNFQVRYVYRFSTRCFGM